MNPFWIADQILQYSLNALIAFLILAALTSGGIKLFKIHNPRVRASLRLIPPLRLMLEPLFWIFPISFTPVNISFFSCSHPLQLYFYGQLSDDTISELNKYGLKSSLGKVLLMIPEPILWSFIAAFVLVIAMRFTMLTADLVRSILNVRRMKSNGIPLTLDPSKVQQFITDHHISMYISKETDIPFAAWGKTIVIPSTVADSYSKEELYAVLAHEAEHILRKDIATRLFIHLSRAIFWWVPLKKWNILIEHEQEMASDAAIYNYSLDKINLATALQKAIHNNTPASSWLTAAFSSKSHQVVRRIQAILSPHSQLHQSTLSIIAVVLLLVALIPIITFIVC